MTKPKRRRQYGAGSVYQRADGRWVGTIEAGYTKTGARRRVTVSAKTEAEAKRRLKDKQRQIDAEGVAETSSRATVKGWADEWLETTVRRLRPGSYTADSGAVRNWIVPTIGHKRLDALTPGDVRAVEKAQRAAGKSSSTALRTHRTLVSLLRAALVEGHRISNAVFAVQAPGKAISDRDAVPVAEAIAILEQASYLPHGSRWATSFLQGMRQGECLGLTWDQVDLDAGWLAVSWQLQQLPYLDRKKKDLGFRVPDGYEVRHLVDSYHLTRPKSAKGHRLIPLVPWIRDSLKAWREATPANPYGLVWPAINGRPAYKRHDNDEWYALQEAARVGHPNGRWYYTHEARHTTATLLMELGVDQAVITAIMGHSSITTSRGYMHASVEHSRKALEQVATRLQLGEFGG